MGLVETSGRSPVHRMNHMAGWAGGPVWPCGGWCWKNALGRTKTDTVDADMLARCEAVLNLCEAPVPTAGQVGLHRTLVRRHQATVDAHRAECRLWWLVI